LSTLGLLSHGVGASLFLVLSALLAYAWRGRLEGALLLSASGVTALWLGMLAAHDAMGTDPGTLARVLEVVRGLAWTVFLARLLGRHPGGRGTVDYLVLGLYGLAGLMLAGFLAEPVLPGSVTDLVGIAKLSLAGRLLLAVGGLMLVEQLFRNTPVERRWAVKFLCFGLGGIFAYDFYLYADALLFRRIDPALWDARGAVQALVVPLLAVSAKRNDAWSVPVFASKTIVFHSATLVGAGGYLLLMAGVGFYIRSYGGSWGTALQAVFFFAAALLLALLLFSGSVRARVRLFLNRHFFEYKYDYREEWLRLISTLTASEGPLQLKENAVRAIAEIVESTGGVLWMRGDSGFFHPVARVELPDPGNAREPVDSPLARFLEREEYVIDLSEYAREPELYPLELPEWLRNQPRAWLVVPLMHGAGLLGFVVLAESRANFTFNWEDTDLLKTVGRQVASYLALMEANEALADARQFEAFNRLSAFVVHDLKNLVAQLSLVVSNARRHMHNPAFVEDAVRTVDNAVAKMNRLLEQLRKNRREWKPAQRVDVSEVLAEVVRVRSGSRPEPRLEAADPGLLIVVDRDRLGAVLGHLVQNAQEATGHAGNVTLRLHQDGGSAVIEVADDGPGMDAQFVRERLFRPFDTTKGNAGMGVGVYETREFVRAHGGTIEVDTAPGRGTTFRLRFALAPPDLAVATA
jgi:putative PEP-CTERM system histidine kinase